MIVGFIGRRRSGSKKCETGQELAILECHFLPGALNSHPNKLLAIGSADIKRL
jgi:hypothetical protein